MNATQERQLVGLKHYQTRYELAAYNIDGVRKVLIGYSSRKGRPGLYSMLRQRLDGGSIDRVIGTREIQFGKKACQGAVMGDWRIIFTGRTQREAILGGELPFICDVQ